jgi:hypothetical protein
MKKCSKCKQEKLFTEFYKGKKPDGYQNECKACGRERYKEYYPKNKKTYLKRGRNYQIHIRKFIQRYKKLYGKCVDCGTTDYRVLQFDHRNNKSFNVSDGPNLSVSIKTIKEEIRKCDVRCANCHQIKTYYNE